MKHPRFAILIVSLPLIGLIYLCAWGIVPDRMAALVEHVMGNTPEAQVAVYLAAVAHGDEVAALDTWELGTSELMDSTRLPDLQARRQTVTQTLLSRRIRADFDIRAIEWYAICCMAFHRTDSPGDATGARVFITVHDQTGAALLYVVDVFHRPGRYRGEEANYPRHEWVIRDVYPVDEQPIFWPTQASYGGV